MRKRSPEREQDDGEATHMAMQPALVLSKHCRRRGCNNRGQKPTEHILCTRLTRLENVDRQ
jgi:hypothetical protein